MSGTAGATKVLYILGTQRSGSTIIGRVIGSQPGFAFAGEVRRLWARGLGAGRCCGCGRSFDTCPQWSQVLPQVLVDGVTSEQVAAWQNEVAPQARSWRHAERIRRAARPGAPPWHALERYQAAMARMYSALRATLHARVIVDSSKLPADAAVLMGVEGVRPFVLHLVRDPRGVVCSQLHRRAPDGRHRPGAVRLPAAWAARHWSAERLARRRGHAGWLRLRYEDFVADPAPALRELAQMVEEPLDGTAAEGPYDLEETHTAGGRMPARRGVRLEADERWLTDLPRFERTLTTATTLPWLVRYGYSL